MNSKEGLGLYDQLENTLVAIVNGEIPCSNCKGKTGKNPIFDKKYGGPFCSLGCRNNYAIEDLLNNK